MSKYLDKNLIKDLMFHQHDFSNIKMFLLASILNEKLVNTELMLNVFHDGRHQPEVVVKIKKFEVTRAEVSSVYDMRVGRMVWRVSAVIDEPSIVCERSLLFPYRSYIDTAFEVRNSGYVHKEIDGDIQPDVLPLVTEYGFTESGWALVVDTSRTILETWTFLLGTGVNKQRVFEPAMVVVEKPNNNECRLVSVETFKVVCCTAPTLLSEVNQTGVGALVDTIVKPFESGLTNNNCYKNSANLITIAEYFEFIKGYGNRTPLEMPQPPVRDNPLLIEFCEMFSQLKR